MATNKVPQPDDPATAPANYTRRIASAFQDVFGQAGRRTDSQEDVFRTLSELCYRDKPIFVVDKAGRFDPLRAAHVDGARTVMLAIDEELRLAANPPVLAQPVRRKKTSF